MNTLNNIISDETLVRIVENYQPKYYHKTLNFLDVVSRIHKPSKINLELNKRLASLMIIEDPKLENTCGLYNHTNNLIRIKPDAPTGAFECILLNIYAYNKQTRTNGFAYGVGLGLSNMPGIAINEFTKQYIINKYFDVPAGYDNFDNSIVSRIINIMGFENFIDSYFEGGLEKLCLYLEYYANINLIKRLIDNLDEYYYLVERCREKDNIYRQKIINSKLCINEILNEIERLSNEIKNNANTSVYTIKN